MVMCGLDVLDMHRGGVRGHEKIVALEVHSEDGMGQRPKD